MVAGINQHARFWTLVSFYAYCIGLDKTEPNHGLLANSPTPLQCYYTFGPLGAFFLYVSFSKKFIKRSLFVHDDRY